MWIRLENFETAADVLATIDIMRSIFCQLLIYLYLASHKWVISSEDPIRRGRTRRLIRAQLFKASLA